MKHRQNPSTRRPAAVTSVLLLVLAFLAFVPVAQGSKGIVGFIGSESPGEAAGQLNHPGGLAVNVDGAGGTSPGDLYVADSGNGRVDEFSPTGSLIRAFGYDVVRSGPDNSSVNAEYELTIAGTGGTFVLEFVYFIKEYGPKAQLSTPLPSDASAAEVQAALESLPKVGAGNVTVTGGPGDATGSRPYHVDLIGVFAGNEPQGNLDVEGNGLQGTAHEASVTRLTVGGAPEVCNVSPPSNDVCKGAPEPEADRLIGTPLPETAGSISGANGLAVEEASGPFVGDIYVAALDRINVFSPDGNFIRAFGQEVVASGPDKVAPRSAVQALIVTATAGSYTLEFGGEETSNLPFNASSAEIEAALTALSSIGSGDATVAETKPGSYEITFAGALSDNPEPAIAAASASGEPLSGGTAAVHTTTAGATGSDICEPANGDICQAGASAADAGAFAAPSALAISPSGAPDAGDLLLADPGNRRVDEFTSAGAFVRSFGTEVIAAGPGAGAGFGECLAAVGDACQAGTAGSAVGQFSEGGPTALTVGANGEIYTVEAAANFRVQQFAPQPGPPALAPSLLGTSGAPNGSSTSNSPTQIAIGPAGDLLTAKGFPAAATPTCPDGLPSAEETRVQELSPDGAALLDTAASCNEISPAQGLAFDPTSAATFLSTSFGGLGGPQRVYAIAPVSPPSIAPEAIAPNTSGAKITAAIDPEGPGSAFPNPPTTSYRFEYKLGSESTWRQFGGELNLGSGTTPVPVTVHLGGLEGNQSYETRFVATKQFREGTVTSAPQAFTTLPVPPSIDGLSSSGLATTTALLHAKVNPNGTDTTCRFEYGPTTAYGQSAPCEPAADIGSAHVDQSVEAHLTGLTEGTTYHFRILAENAAGTSESEDQSFEFLPPSCPNAAVRQQTASNYLPDCRGYELVSPSNANATFLFTGGPNTGLATDPSRFAFVGQFSSLPGTEPIDTAGDLYVATRTDTGWVSHYIGLSGSQAGCIGSPPDDPWSRSGTSPTQVQDHVSTDPSMSRFLDFIDGPPALCVANGNGTGDATGELALPSNVGYLWNAEGAPVATLPSDLADVSGAAAALSCPQAPGNPFTAPGICTGDVATSGDLNHFVFSTNQLAFAPGGLTAAPGSAYDDNLQTGEVTLISRLKNGDPIPQDAAFARTPAGAEEFLRFPAVSADGSHILISTATVATPHCGGDCQRFVDTPIHLYMSIDDAPVREVSVNQQTGENVAVDYIGTAEGGAKVFFTSEEQLTAEDRDHSTDLYMWSEKGEEEGHPLTLISKGDNPGNQGEPGNTDNCNPELGETLNENGEPSGTQAPWTSKCGVLAYSGWNYANASASRGGNGVSDTAIASQNGDIYFYSPELLDGEKGIEGQQNLYDYREGRPRFVATFTPGHTCLPSGPFKELICSAGPIARIQVSSNDSHMALVSADRLTAYDNTDLHGSCQEDAEGEPTGETHCTEMYSYTPATGSLVCDSCNPIGASPTSDVYASQDGLFMTEDGRTFFSTAESLLPQDTNEGEDVYEFVDGRPHLITSGTGTAGAGHGGTAHEQTPGLIGASANGTDVYFSTYDVLTSEDHNGHFLKFYDARTDGGFPQPPPVAPCAAAEECHGPGSEAPTLPTQGTIAPLTGGNVGSRPRSKHHKSKTKHKHKKSPASTHHARSHRRGAR